MTTTAEKIEKKIKHLEEEIEVLREMIKVIKLPDPEPLEYWAALNEHGDALWLAKDKTKASGADITTILMREVTPQMEQDQLNARRYRQAKREAAEGTRGSLFWTMPHVCVWDREFDKAMEES